MTNSEKMNRKKSWKLQETAMEIRKATK